MKVLKPIPFDVDYLVSSNATEPYSTWSSGTTYAKDAYVDYGTHFYQSLVNNNTNNQPDTSPAKWVFIGPDNTHAMFDSQVSTQTVSDTPLIVTVDIPYSNSAAFLNLSGTMLEIEVTDGGSGPTVYSATYDLETSAVYDWYMYFFEPFSFITEIIITDIPPYKYGQLTMTLSGPSGTDVKIGEMVWGTVYDLGEVEYGSASVGIIDYSRKETDEFGNTTFVQRAYSKRMEVRAIFDTVMLNKVHRILADVRATPCVWIGGPAESIDYEPLTIYGFYRDFSVDIAYPTKSYCSLSIEGLI